MIEILTVLTAIAAITSEHERDPAAEADERTRLATERGEQDLQEVRELLAETERVRRYPSRRPRREDKQRLQEEGYDRAVRTISRPGLVETLQEPGEIREGVWRSEGFEHDVPWPEPEDEDWA